MLGFTAPRRMLGPIFPRMSGQRVLAVWKEEFYQLTLGGSGDETASVGEIIGPGFSYDDVVDAIETVVDTYLKVRASPEENFLAAYRRLGQAPFKEALYGAA